MTQNINQYVSLGPRFGHVKIVDEHYTLQWQRSTVLSADTVKQWHSKKALESPGTARLYPNQLNIYWNNDLHTKYSIIDEYVSEVRKEQEKQRHQRPAKMGLGLRNVRQQLCLET